MKKNTHMQENPHQFIWYESILCTVFSHVFTQKRDTAGTKGKLNAKLYPITDTRKKKNCNMTPIIEWTYQSHLPILNLLYLFKDSFQGKQWYYENRPSNYMQVFPLLSDEVPAMSRLSLVYV